jgi:glycosyltransferase involved in cell wall biosynthesis
MNTERRRGPDVVLATTAGTPGGVWRHMVDLGVGLRDRGRLVDFALPREATTLHERARAAGFTSSVIGTRPRSTPAVWHLHLGDTFDRAALLHLVRARLSSARVVVTEHLPRTDASDPTLAGRPPRPAARMAKYAFKRAEFALADRVITVSQGSARFLRRRYRFDGRLIVIPNGVSLPAPGVDAGPFRRGEPPMRVVVAASLIAQKGLDDLVAAARRAREEWTVDVWGDGAHRHRLEQLAADARATDGGPRVRFHGWSDQVEAQIQSADVLVVPSRWEASSYAALEAMSHCVAVVATRIDGLEDIVADGVTGVLVPPGDPAALAVAIDDLATDLPRRTALGAAGRRRVGAHFALGEMVDETLRAYAGAADSDAAISR